MRENGRVIDRMDKARKSIEKEKEGGKMGRKKWTEKDQMNK